MEQAKVYYCHAIRLNPNNMRSLYGLLLVSNVILSHFRKILKYFILQTSTQLVSSPRSTAQKKNEYKKSVIWASTQVR